MLSSRAFACALNAGAGVKLRSSLRRSEYSAAFCWVTRRKHTVPSLRFQRGQTGPDAGRKIGIAYGPVAQEHSIVRDGGDHVPALVGDHGEVVVRAGVARVERDRAAQELARLGRSPG